VDSPNAVQELDLVVARVTFAESHRGARGPSALLHLDLGPRGEAQSPLPVRIDDAQDLVGRQVVCAVGTDEVTVLAVHGSEGVVPLHPAREVDEGAPVA